MKVYYAERSSSGVFMGVAQVTWYSLGVFSSSDKAIATIKEKYPDIEWTEREQWEGYATINNHRETVLISEMTLDQIIEANVLVS